MTTTTTLADLAHTCREKAAELLNDVWEWHGNNEPPVPPAAHDKAADWQALANLIDYAAYGTRGNQVVVAAKRLAARLDRP